MRQITSLVLWLVCAAAVVKSSSASERHVLVVVWDGMRPDFVTEQNTPTLWKLAREGVIFRNHHSVYPSVTLVNGTALVTGVYPGRNGIIANHVYRHEIDPQHAIDVELSPVVNKGDELSSGKYISVPTLAELIQGAGGRTVIAAAKTVGLLLDRQPDIKGQLGDVNRRASSDVDSEIRGSRSVTLFAGKSLPPDVLSSITDELGPFPSPHLQQDTWTTKALTDVLWKDGVPELSILWLGEPDLTQHESAPGAPEALAAIKSADENLAVVLETLHERKMLSTTDVFVVSDHGFSTIGRSIDLPKLLNEAGFNAKTQFESEPKPGDIMLVGNGGSVLFYVIGQDHRVTRRVVEFLQQSDFAGVIFTRQPMEGTFAQSEVKMDSAVRWTRRPCRGSTGNKQSGERAASTEVDHVPDVVMAFRWNDSKNQFGIPGMIDADWQRAAGKGTHGTLSPFDMHNMLIAAGPDFRHGLTDDLPTGNTDLAPTILQILGIKTPEAMDGRILSEAMPNRNAPAPRAETKAIEGTKNYRGGVWRQSLKISRVGTTVYLDEGNGVFQKTQGKRAAYTWSTCRRSNPAVYLLIPRLSRR